MEVINKEPHFLRGSDGNCGMAAIAMALDGIGIEINPLEVERIAMENGIIYFKEMYTREQTINILEMLKNNGYRFRYEINAFNTDEEMRSILEKCISNGGYNLLAYYALQGFVISPRKINMEHPHWSVIYGINNKGGLYGIQSNSKANMLKVIYGVSYKSMYKSNVAVGRVKVDWGKYHKCEIRVFKKELGVSARCKCETCLLNNKMRASKCIYNCDINNFIVSIYK